MNLYRSFVIWIRTCSKLWCCDSYPLINYYTSFSSGFSGLNSPQDLATDTIFFHFYRSRSIYFHSCISKVLKFPFYVSYRLGTFCIKINYDINNRTLYSPCIYVFIFDLYSVGFQQSNYLYYYTVTWLFDFVPFW